MNKKTIIESFENLKVIGDKGEAQAQNFITSVFNTAILSSCNNSDYDFLTSDNVKYEVKFDAVASRTKNLFVEFRTLYYNKDKNYVLRDIQSIKNSGLSISKSDKYIFVLYINHKYIFIMMDTIILRQIIKNCNYKITQHYNKYYNSESEGFIIPIKDVIKNGQTYILDNDIYSNIEIQNMDNFI